MFLNDLKPAEGSRKASRRLGRGIGCTVGKTCGKGHKGQKARAGGYHKLGFEGGQMPLQRRLPKVGFNSQKKKFSAEVRLTELSRFVGLTVDIKALKEAGLISAQVKTARIIDAGILDVTVNTLGIRVSKGARAKIEATGGRVEV